MKTKSRFVALAAAAILVVAGTVTAHAQPVQSALDRIISAKKIVIGVQNDVPPYSQIGKDNQVEGLDIDVARQLAKDLGVQLELVVVTGANRIPTLLSNRADLVIATVGINPQRAATIAMSIPYTAYPAVIIAPASIKLGSYNDAKDKVIGLTRGTMQDEIVSRNAEGADIRRYEDDATTIQALVTGQIDATAFGASVARDLITKNPSLKLETKFDAFYVHASIAARRGDADLMRWVDTWIFYNKNSGFLVQTHKKWLGIEMPTLPTF